jgi:hypothetical protein
VGGTDGLVGGETFSGCHHLSTNGRQPPAHRQIPTQVLPDERAPTSVQRRRAGVRIRQPKNTNVTLAACDVLGGPPVRTAQQRPVRRTDSHVRPSGGRWHRKQR